MMQEILQKLGLAAFADIFKQERMDVERFEKLYKRGCMDMLTEDLRLHQTMIEKIHQEL